MYLKLKLIKIALKIYDMAPILATPNVYHLTLAGTILWTRKHKMRRSKGLKRFPNCSFKTKIPRSTAI